MGRRKGDRINRRSFKENPLGQLIAYNNKARASAIQNIRRSRGRFITQIGGAKRGRQIASKNMSRLVRAVNKFYDSALSKQLKQPGWKKRLTKFGQTRKARKYKRTAKRTGGRVSRAAAARKAWATRRRLYGPTGRGRRRARRR